GEAPELDDPDLEAEPVPAQARSPLERPSRGRGDAEPGAATEVTFDASGRILRDNVYGTVDEDVWRRDFTVNALYYNIADFSLWDYVGGAEDIKTRTLRLIGDPETRFRVDPLRMLRAARFDATPGYQIEPATATPVGALRQLLSGSPSSRLFDAPLKL